MGKWEKVRLGELTKIRTGKLDANANDENGRFPFFTCAVTPLRIDSYSYDCECVLVAGNGDLNVKYYKGKFDAYQRTYIIESLSSDRLYLPYLYRFLQMYITVLRTQTSGGVIKYIRLNSLTDAKLPLPPVHKQKRIAKNLDLASEIVKGYKDQLAELDKLVQSVFYEMFGDPVTNEKGWEEREIGDIYEINPKKSELHISKDIEVSFIPMQAVSALGEIDLSLTKRFSEVEKGFTYFKENDVLFAKITPCMENGKGAVAKGLKNGIGVGSTEFHVLRGKNGYSEAIWLYYFMKLDVFREQAKSNMTGSAGQKRVPASYLAKYKLPLPPLPLQTHFASIVTEIEVQKAQIQQALTEAENLFNSLMQEYFD